MIWCTRYNALSDAEKCDAGIENVYNWIDFTYFPMS